MVLSDEEQPLSPTEEEKRPMQRSSTRDKNKKSSTCFLLATGDFSCAADGGIQKGMADVGSVRWRFVVLTQDSGSCPSARLDVVLCSPDPLVLLPLHLLHVCPPRLSVLALYFCFLLPPSSPPLLPPFGVCDPGWLHCPPWGQLCPFASQCSSFSCPSSSSPWASITHLRVV